MPKSVDEVFQNGELVSSIIQPWTQADILLLLADVRWKMEVAGVYVGEQFFSTERHEFATWMRRIWEINHRPGVITAFPYKPIGGMAIVLTPEQVVRAEECMSWYVNACFETERTFQNMLLGSQGQGWEELLVAITSEISWPQRQFTWETE